MSDKNQLTEKKYSGTKNAFQQTHGKKNKPPTARAVQDENRNISSTGS